MVSHILFDVLGNVEISTAVGISIPYLLQKYVETSRTRRNTFSKFIMFGNLRIANIENVGSCVYQQTIDKHMTNT